ncbi:hypothetical protein [Streptomyces violascens]|uniref:hypothetical protein n=1 Tax=Streptomyces violascens TaxID=67381 RepID=UPI0036B4552A
MKYMGEETDNGNFDNPYRVQFPFTTMDGKHYLFGHNMKPHGITRKRYTWFIQELKPDGKMGSETDSGEWANAYRSVFPFRIKGRTFLLAQHLVNRYFFIQELLPGGKLGKETQTGTWQRPYGVMFPYWVDDELYFFGHNQNSHFWFIQRLEEGGKLGQATDSDTWDAPYDVAFPFQAGLKTYMYGYSTKTKRWFTRELLAGGKMAEDETDEGYFEDSVAVQFPYNIDGRQYLYGQRLDTKRWFIRELLPDGKLGDRELDSNSWNRAYAVQFPFEIGGRQFFYGQDLDGNNHWFIQELLGKGEPTPDEWAKVYIWSYRGTFEAFGHASLNLSDGTYISWWPSGMSVKTIPGLPDELKAEAVPDQTYEKDKELEGYSPDIIITIPGGDEGVSISDITRWWGNFKDDKGNKYQLDGQNCAKTVADALFAGGAGQLLGGTSGSWRRVSPWYPWVAQNFAAAIRDRILSRE